MGTEHVVIVEGDLYKALYVGGEKVLEQDFLDFAEMLDYLSDLGPFSYEIIYEWDEENELTLETGRYPETLDELEELRSA